MTDEEAHLVLAWSVAFILHYYGGHIPVERIRKLYAFAEEELLQAALRKGLNMGVIHSHEGVTYWAEPTRAKEVLLWHEWADVGLNPFDPRGPAYEALLVAYVNGAPNMETLKNELLAIPPPDNTIRLKHRTPHSHCSVYFIQMGAPEDGGPIKIGFSVSLRARLRAIQEHCPFELRILHSAPGDRVEEALLHSRFASARLPRGEWFQPVSELLDLIARKPVNLYDEGTDRQGWTPPLNETGVSPPIGSIEAYLSGSLSRLISRARHRK